jgi:energy-coupling factor transport system ATP-binding protein
MKSQHKETILEVSRLSFSFETDQPPILKELSFSIKDDETVLVLGPSGSGKSTLAYCLNNLYPGAVDGIMSGTLHFRGRNSASFLPGEINQSIGLVMQDPDAQFCMLTVEDEIAFVLENISIPRAKMDQKIDLALELVNMQSLKTRMIHSLSGGQKQKLAIACALAMEPELLILDEPTANLDPASSSELIQTLKRLKEHHSLCILVIEHNVDYWLEIVDRCIILNSEGQMIFDGGTRECFSVYVEDLAKEGIWLPLPVDAGLKLKEAGMLETADTVPMTIDEIIMGSKNIKQSINFLKNQRSIKEITSDHSIFEVNKIYYKKNDVEILKNLSFSIAPGEFIAIAGSNGSGKTTFSRCLAGLSPISKGKINFFESPLDAWKEKLKWKKLGYVFQNPEHQFITDSVYDEIHYSLSGNHAELWKSEEIITQLNMTSHINSHPFSLSQGQKRRLSVAVMLINGQEVLILDEPTFGQDAITSREIINLVMSSVPDTGCVIMITHDMNLIDQYADKVLVLNHGEALFFGPPGELWLDENTVTKANLKLPFIKELEKKLQMYNGEEYAIK